MLPYDALIILLTVWLHKKFSESFGSWGNSTAAKLPSEVVAMDIKTIDYGLLSGALTLPNVIKNGQHINFNGSGELRIKLLCRYMPFS